MTDGQGFAALRTVAEAQWRTAIGRAVGVLPDATLDRLGCPLVMAEHPAFVRSAHRTLLLGQETAHWSMPGARSLRDCISLDDPVRELADAYEAYDFGVGAPRVHFIRALRRLERELEEGVRGAVMWSNVAHIDCAPAGRPSASIAALPAAEREAVLAWQGGILRAEVGALEPRAVIAMCGPKYDGTLDAEFPGLAREPVGDVPLRDLARLVHPELPAASFRTHHPRTLEIAKHPHLGTIITRVKELTGGRAEPGSI